MDDRVVRVFENTYIMAPDPKEKFDPIPVRKVIRSVLEEALEGMKYDAEQAPTLSRTLCDEIRAAVGELGYSRYKLVCEVVLSQRQGQGIHVGVRSLWNVDHDNAATETFCNPSLIAVATVFGLYYE